MDVTAASVKTELQKETELPAFKPDVSEMNPNEIVEYLKEEQELQKGGLAPPKDLDGSGKIGTT